MPFGVTLNLLCNFSETGQEGRRPEDIKFPTSFTKMWGLVLGLSEGQAPHTTPQQAVENECLRTPLYVPVTAKSWIRVCLLLKHQEKAQNHQEHRLLSIYAHRTILKCIDSKNAIGPLHLNNHSCAFAAAWNPHHFGSLT